MKISVLTLGCKVNKYESDSLIFELNKRGFETTDKLEYADAYIINTCAVTNEAERKSRQMIERARKFNCAAKIFVMGCASQNKASQFEGHGVQFLMGNALKKHILDELENVGQRFFDLPSEYEDDLFSAQSLSRAYIKIQDGCNRFCTYCIIPYLRGRSRSRSVESVVAEVAALPETVKEIVLVGIDVSDFQINGEKGLGDLLQKLDVFGKRIRLSSMEDSLIDEKFLNELAGLKNFCPHFHLSLQSGCDDVLKKMNRHYTTFQFAESVKKIREVFPLAAITTDVIVGFPTETEENFQETLHFIENVGFSQLHVFPYSKRTGTAAAKLYQDLPKSVKNARVQKLVALGEKLRTDFISQNSEVDILIEEKIDGYFVGYSKNYIFCYLRDDSCSEKNIGGENCAQIEKSSLHVGDIVHAKVVKAYKNGALCEIL